MGRNLAFAGHSRGCPIDVLWDLILYLQWNWQQTLLYFFSDSQLVSGIYRSHELLGIDGRAQNDLREREFSASRNPLSLLRDVR